MSVWAGIAYGAFHRAEGLLLAGELPPVPGVDVAAARAALYDAWRGFIHDGNPGWPRHEPGAAPYVIR